MDTYEHSTTHDFHSRRATIIPMLNRNMTVAEAELLAQFIEAPTIRARLEVKRRAFAQGHLMLVHQMLGMLVPSQSIRLEVRPE